MISDFFQKLLLHSCSRFVSVYRFLIFLIKIHVGLYKLIAGFRRLLSSDMSAVGVYLVGRAASE